MNDEKKPTDAVREFAERYEKRIAELEEQIAESAGGTLTAEQVREAWCGNLKRDCLYDPPTPDWQAIADELNARTERTCRNVCEEWAKTSFAHAETSFCCSECGAHYVDCESYYAGLADADGEQIRTNFCPNCGAKVVE